MYLMSASTYLIISYLMVSFHNIPSSASHPLASYHILSHLIISYIICHRFPHLSSSRFLSPPSEKSLPHCVHSSRPPPGLKFSWYRVLRSFFPALSGVVCLPCHALPPVALHPCLPCSLPRDAAFAFFIALMPNAASISSQHVSG